MKNKMFNNLLSNTLLNGMILGYAMAQIASPGIIAFRITQIVINAYEGIKMAIKDPSGQPPENLQDQLEISE